MAAGDQDAQRLAEQQYASADNMTDSMAALSALINYGQGDYPQQALAAFDKWRDNPLVIDKWFALQATARSTTVQNARELMAHPAFTLRNPNRARALVFQFCLNNARGMHHPDGSGYAFWADQVLALDALNPEIAARLARALDNWSRYVPALRAPMKEALQRVRAQDGLSRNVQEIVSKALNSQHRETLLKRKTLTQYLVEQQRSAQALAPEVRLLIEVVARACKAISHAVSKGALGGVLAAWTARTSRAKCRRNWTCCPTRSCSKPMNGRPPRGHGLGRDGNHPSDPEPLPQGRIPAAVRSAGRLVEHRRERVDRHHLLGAARPARGRRPGDRSGLPATRQTAGRGRLRTARRPCWC